MPAPPRSGPQRLSSFSVKQKVTVLLRRTRLPPALRTRARSYPASFLRCAPPISCHCMASEARNTARETCEHKYTASQLPSLCGCKLLSHSQHTRMDGTCDSGETNVCLRITEPTVTIVGGKTLPRIARRNAPHLRALPPGTQDKLPHLSGTLT